MPPLLVCIHDASPAFAAETRVIIRDLAPLLGTRLSVGVVPDWHGDWPLTAHRDYCRFLRDASEELLLHGYFHRRQRGWGPVSLVAERCDEMSALDPGETRRTIERGQQLFTDIFGEPARGFLAPGWQRGHVRPGTADAAGLEHVLGFLSLESSNGRRASLATSTWDCGRWRWLGYLGHGIGWLLRFRGGRVPVVAIHPRDVRRGFWPRILDLTRELREGGFQPTTPARLLEAGC